MPMRYVKCEHCPTWFKTPFSARKHCLVCQILRDYDFKPGAYGKPKHCEHDHCKREFFPPKLSWAVCPDCTLLAEQPSRYPACHRCGEHWKTAPGTESTCLRCVQRTAADRISYIQFLTGVRERLIASNPAPPQDYVDWVALYGGEIKPPKPPEPDKPRKKSANSGKNSKVEPSIR